MVGGPDARATAAGSGGVVVVAVETHEYFQLGLTTVRFLPTSCFALMLFILLIMIAVAFNSQLLILLLLPFLIP